MARILALLICTMTVAACNSKTSNHQYAAAWDNMQYSSVSSD